MALGAQTPALFWMVLRESLTLLEAGLLVGVPVALGVACGLASFLKAVAAIRAKTGVDVNSLLGQLSGDLVSTSQGAFKLVNKPFTKEPYGIGIAKGNTAFCQFINDTLKASDADGSYSAAWKATVGTVQPEVPPLPTADACS